MARKHKGVPIHGWVIIDKPEGMTSTQVVGAVRRITNAAKVGHGGTLDPMASGLLPIALGEATKTVNYAMDGAKSYEFTVKWGEETDSADAEGEITGTNDARPDQQAVLTAIPRFIGRIEQTPPIFSAVKINGQRAYDLARKGEAVEVKSRTVRIDRFELVNIIDTDHADFIVDCGKGTYVRSLGRDLAKALGTCGHLCRLRRTKVGSFDLKMAISLDKLDALVNSAPAETWLRPVATVLDDIPALALTPDEARAMRQGQAVSLLQAANRLPELDKIQGSTLVAFSKGTPIALARIERGKIQPVRVLNL